MHHCTFPDYLLRLRFKRGISRLKAALILIAFVFNESSPNIW